MPGSMFTADDLAVIRRAYAVPREEILGPPPWLIAVSCEPAIGCGYSLRAVA